MPQARFTVYVLLLLALTPTYGILADAANHINNISANADNLFAGFRASRILTNYPNEEFPPPSYWASVSSEMAGRFPDARPGGVWVVALYDDDGITELSFPSGGASYPYIRFTDEDCNEPYLNAFDDAGVKVWLQVEPGAANVDTLIDLVLQRYKHHQSVIGFGIDVEWYHAESSTDGRKVTNYEAQLWEQHVKSTNQEYTLFLKHWDTEWMPPSYRGDILFIDDSQQLPSLQGLVEDFAVWGSTFAPNNVGFQIGYPHDRWWWSKYADPAKAMGDEILAEIPNTAGLFWVDFTITEVFPPVSTSTTSTTHPTTTTTSSTTTTPHSTSTTTSQPTTSTLPTTASPTTPTTRATTSLTLTIALAAASASMVATVTRQSKLRQRRPRIT